MSERLFQFGTAQLSFWPGLDGNFDSGTDLERIWNGFGTDLFPKPNFSCAEPNA